MNRSYCAPFAIFHAWTAFLVYWRAGMWSPIASLGMFLTLWAVSEWAAGDEVGA